MKISWTTLILVCIILMLSACAGGEGQAPDRAGADVSEAAGLTVSTGPVGASGTPEPSWTVAPQTPTATPTPLPTETETPTSTPTTPEEHTILGVYGHKQYFPLGCETSVAVDWAAFFGVEINEFEFQYRLPLSDNPELGFVGSVEGPWGQVPPYAYGVHAAPVAALLQEYGLNAVAVKEMRLEELKRQIAMDQPVIAWVIGNVVGGVPYLYTDSQGNSTVVAAYEHTIIVFGYTAESIRYNNNGKVYEIPTEVFLNSWGVLNNMAIVLGEG